MIRKSLPQNDILDHSNVVLFITNGGLNSVMESIHHAVPMLFIPFSADQIRNAHRAKSDGYGKILEFRRITEDSLTKNIKEIISEKSYAKNVKKISSIFRHNAIHPLKEAVFWIEHVAKFKGAPHLKSHALEMSWFTYLSIDIAIATLLTAIAGFYVLRILIAKFFPKAEEPKELESNKSNGFH